MKVQLYVYDLSNGLARMLSVSLIGKLLEGIWHTSVVAFGKETYFGQGIFQSAPGKTAHGAPLRIIQLGETKKTESEFAQFLQSIESRYRAVDYKLLEHNCNNFSNELSMFLTGTKIPTYILDLPREVMATEGGKALLPFIEQFYGDAARSIQPQTPLAQVAKKVMQNQITENSETVLRNTHRHVKLGLDKFNGVDAKFSVFAKPPPASIVDKLSTFSLNTGEQTEMWDSIRESLLQDPTRSIPDPTLWIETMDKILLSQSNVQLQYAMVDLLRYWILQYPQLCPMLQETVLPWCIDTLQSKADQTKADAQILHRMLLKLLANMFAHCSKALPEPTTIILEIVQLHMESAEDNEMRNVASSVLYNLAVKAHSSRVQTTRSDDDDKNFDSALNMEEDWIVECTTATLEYLRDQEDKTAPYVNKLLSALGYFLYEAPQDLLDLVTMLGAEDTLAAYANGTSEECKTIAEQTARLLD